MKWFGKLIDKLRRSAPAPETALSEHNNTTNIHHMAKKTVITKVLDTNAQDGVIEFPQNRTLYVDQFTDKAPTTDEEREGFRPKSLKEVFEHYQPLIAQSPLLSEKKAKIDAYNAIVRQLQKNKPLRNALKDAASRASLLDVLKSLKAEIDAAE